MIAIFLGSYLVQIGLKPRDAICAALIALVGTLAYPKETGAQATLRFAIIIAVTAVVAFALVSRVLP